MIGGKIVSVRRRGERATILVVGTSCSDKGDHLRVDTLYQGDIPPGSSIWWQARHLFIHPPGVKNEYDIGRVGYSYRLK